MTENVQELCSCLAHLEDVDKAPENIYLRALETKGAKGKVTQRGEVTFCNHIFLWEFATSGHKARGVWLCLSRGPLLAELMAVSGLEKQMQRQDCNQKGDAES